MTRDWRRTRAVLLRYADNADHHYTQLMRTGASYGHQCVVADIGDHGEVIDVKLTDQGVFVLYEPHA